MVWGLGVQGFRVSGVWVFVTNAPPVIIQDGRYCRGLSLVFGLGFGLVCSGLKMHVTVCAWGDINTSCRRVVISHQ